jgi:hypothetical protein
VKLEVELDRHELRPGEAVEGTVRVVEGGGSRRLTVALLFRERTADYSEVAREVPGPELCAGDLEAGASFRFAIRLPDDALPPVSSPHGAIWWEVDAKSDELGPDTHVRRELQVLAPAREAS